MWAFHSQHSRTEKAFKFYKTIFNGEFGGKGIQRFGDIPAPEGQQEMSDELKKMIIHVELQILGGHVLMATDSPKEMGLTLTQGSNMHICLEPSTKTETKRLFDALSKDGHYYNANTRHVFRSLFWHLYRPIWNQLDCLIITRLQCHRDQVDSAGA